MRISRGLISLLLITAVQSCARPIDDRELSEHGFYGREVAEATPLPTETFTDTHGLPYRLDEKNPGKVVLLFFGYTHCPDVCPVHLANLGAVLKRLPYEVSREITVVFVTTDPARDSLPLLERWVKGFHPDFVGLSGSDSLLIAAQHSAGLSIAAEREPGVSDSVYSIGHLTQVIAYTKDGLRRVEYPFGTRQSDWAHDLPLLIDFRKR